MSDPTAADASAAIDVRAPWLARHAVEVDRALYAAFAGACVLYVALLFYGSMFAQTGGAWSAPLDDVFIHFDYARAIARGYPFEWSEGNGYSSGNTSLTYPFVLALGYWVGFRDIALMKWAAMVACGATTAFLFGAARIVDSPEMGLPRWSKYLLPPTVLGLGALGWTLFSGMENAFHLAVWSACALPSLDLARRAGDARAVRRLGWVAGAAGALLFATRPESVACVAAFALFAALRVRTRLGNRAALATVVRMGTPGVLVFAGHTIANRVLTGEWAANGAIAKLALNNPYMTAAEKWDEYLHFLKYVVLRNTQHHFADKLPWGWLVPAVALVPLVFRPTRAVATLLWAQVAGWLLLVSLNGQVRWQNERYTMPAVAWLLILAAMGVAALVRPPAAPWLHRWRWWTSAAGRAHALRVAAAVVAVILFAVHQAPNVRDQVWFFGRASRNIRDQHVLAGRELARMDARRVLVGDAGALIYASDRPGLDLIGLGGYRDLPFARAAVHGMGSSLELVERMPREERPDVMAIYPSWWGDLPGVFGQRLDEFPVVGNVICGDAVKVVYRADWAPLDRAGRPRSLRQGEAVIDEIDVADLVSERAHRYEFPRPSAGFVGWRVLTDPADRTRDLFDAGRIVPPGRSESFVARMPLAGGRMIARTAAAHPAAVEVWLDGARLGAIVVERTAGWGEFSIDVPSSRAGTARVELRVVDGEWTNHHVWVVAPR